MAARFCLVGDDASSDGTIYVAGIGVVAKLNEQGRILKMVQSDEQNFPSGKASGIAVTEKELFVCFESGWSLRSLSSVVRFTRDLTEPKVILQNLRGCCQRLDIVAQDGVLFIAENARHRVLRCDREGNILSKWGNRDPRRIEGFGSCCNPMNLCFGQRSSCTQPSRAWGGSSGIRRKASSLGWSGT